MRLNISICIQVSWILVGLVWAFGWFSAKGTRRAQATRSRFFHLELITTAFLLLFSVQLRVGVLAARVVPTADWVPFLGFSLTIVGILFAIWSRASLGRNWSGRVAIQKEHRLICQGPYAIVRHPIYSGLLVAMLGTALAYGHLVCLLAVPLAFAAWWMKSKVEEEFLAAQFGHEYADYQRKVRALIPFVL
jgi:protein-S-isoprenylcysteine O-methyltransferase Ste14